ncbi:hypothetical protein [Aliivibrio fischeri]|uniref:hypothetical protein n=1 Tax=Aliivibrio fischeri TaxID=668 RepID=UPI0012DA3310|nr:hypothetical protein [Aliivibrio fischeri]MUJ26314.1 hypothetical protein [Aliivibrio fischeri]
MSDKELATNGYQPRIQTVDVTKGYQPTRTSEPGAGYQPTNSGGNPTSNPTPTPPGAE